MKYISYLFLFGLIVTGLSIAPEEAQAESITSYVEHVGCPLGSSRCFVQVSEAVGPSECNNRSIRWNTTAAGGLNALTLLTTAFAANKQVYFEISDSCYSEQANPTFSWIIVQE